jgi:hypothetical protein
VRAAQQQLHLQLLRSLSPTPSQIAELRAKRGAEHDAV